MQLMQLCCNLIIANIIPLCCNYCFIMLQLLCHYVTTILQLHRHQCVDVAMMC